MDAFTILQTVGRCDIAALTGVFLGGAVYGVPIVLDGIISMTAALVAVRIRPEVRDFLIPSRPAGNRLGTDVDGSVAGNAGVQGDMAPGKEPELL